VKYNVNGFTGVDPRCCQYPTDAVVTGKIHEESLFGRGMDILSKYGVERVLLSIHNSSSIRLTKKMAPHIFEMVDEACALFGVDVRPEIFMYREYGMNMDLIGSDKPVLLISTSLLSKADEKVLWGIVSALLAFLLAKGGL